MITAKIRKVSLFFLLFLLFPSLVYAFKEDLILSSEDIRFSTATFLEGRPVRIYAAVESRSPRDARGVVKFFDGGSQISGDQPISVLATREDSVFVDWVPLPGQHTIKVVFSLFDEVDDDPSNNRGEKTVTVLADADRDGTPNDADSDDDGDGVADESDAFPLNKKEAIDSDGDGTGNNQDTDDDNDGTEDAQDALPLNTNEQLDTDADSLGNNEDTDDDGDGVADIDELKNHTDPLKKDSDGDGADDFIDAYPLDPTKAYDYDRDGLLDPDDSDADNDGILKASDVNDTNLGPVILLTQGGSGDSVSRLGFPGKDFEFSAQTAFDPDGEIANVTFVTDGESSSGAVLKKSFASAGKYEIKVTATDNDGESREKTFVVYIVARWMPWAIGAIMACLILGVLLYLKAKRARY